jgi:hypothetical protein
MKGRIINMNIKFVTILKTKALKFESTNNYSNTCEVKYCTLKLLHSHVLLKFLSWIHQCLLFRPFCCLFICLFAYCKCKFNSTSVSFYQNT